MQQDMQQENTCTNIAGWEGKKRLKGRWKDIYLRLGLNIATKRCRLSSSATFGGETTSLQGGVKGDSASLFLRI